MSTAKFNKWENPDGTENFKCRAWVNFNGTTAGMSAGSQTGIRAQGNVSGITDNGTGDYTIHFLNAMPDANYTVAGTTSANAGATLTGLNIKTGTTPTTSAVVVTTFTGSGTAQDYSFVNVAIFR